MNRQRHWSFPPTLSIMPPAHSPKSCYKRSFMMSWTKICCSALVPIMIGIFTVVTTLQQRSLSDRQYDQQQNQRLDIERESVFTSYILEMSRILQEQRDDNLNLYIRTHTLTALRKLDWKRKTYLFLFLYESKLICLPNKLDLNGADFSHVNLNEFGGNHALVDVYLPNINLHNASFNFYYMLNCHFMGSTMTDVKMKGAWVHYSQFEKCVMDRADLRQLTSVSSSYRSARLTHADLNNYTFIAQNDFTNANLNGVHMQNHTLYDASLMNIFDNAILQDNGIQQVNTYNLVVNGNAEENCPTSLNGTIHGWRRESKPQTAQRIITIFNHNEELGNCSFAMGPEDVGSASMSQLIDISHYSLLIDQNSAQYNLSIYFDCDLSIVWLVMNQMINRGMSLHNAVKLGGHGQRGPRSADGLLQKDTTALGLTIVFNHTKESMGDGNKCIVDDVQLKIRQKR